MKSILLSTLLVLGLIPVTVSAERLSLSSLQNQLNLLATMLQDTNSQLAETRAELAAAQGELSALRNNSVLKLDGVVTLTRDAAGITTVLISAANLQLVNGSGVTDSVNGLGNFVVGYNASNEAFVDRFGSHNLVVGDDQSYSDTQEIITENLHSDHGLTLTVAKDMSTVIGGDQLTSVASNRSLQVGESNNRSVGSAEAITVGASKTVTVGVNKTVTVGADQTQNIGGSDTISVGMEQNVNIGGDQALSIGANRSIAVAGDKIENIGGSASLDVATDASATYARNLSVIIGKELSVDAGDQVQLQTGTASALLKKDGNIQIEGKDITLRGSGGVNVEASGNVVIRGSQILQN